ncbi:MAG TPA: hypothetical protein VF209_01330 [Patescibacteria group bacterium]
MTFIDESAVKELQAILKEDYSQNLSMSETKTVGVKLINLYKTLWLPSIHATKKPQSLLRTQTDK